MTEDPNVRAASNEGAEQRSLSTDIAIGLGPTIAVATKWALDQIGSHPDDQPKEPAPKRESPPRSPTTED